jgi:hypothetical protein
MHASQYDCSISYASLRIGDNAGPYKELKILDYPWNGTY